MGATMIAKKGINLIEYKAMFVKHRTKMSSTKLNLFGPIAIVVIVRNRRYRKGVTFGS